MHHVQGISAIGLNVCSCNGKYQSPSWMILDCYPLDIKAWET